MRLCIIANLSIHTQRYLRYFVERGHEVHLIGVRKPHVPPPPGVTVHDLTAHSGMRKLRWLVWGRTVRRIVAELKPDVLHAQQIAPAGWLGAAAGYHPLMVTAWGSDLLVGAQTSWVFRQLARWALRRADYVTCVSQGLAQAALALGADPNRLEVAPWGVDVEVYHPSADREAPRERLAALRPALLRLPYSAAKATGRPAGRLDGPIVLSVRSIKAVYRPLDIAQAIPRVLEQVPAARFVVRTHNSNAQKVAQFQATVQAGGASEAVRYVGELPDEEAIADLYRAADVAVSVPSSDGTPSSVLEAVACGAVPVVSDVPSLHEWLAHEREALFVPVGDVQAIAASIVRLLSDETLRGQMAADGARMIRERADSRVWMRRNEEIYRRLTKSEASS